MDTKIYRRKNPQKFSPFALVKPKFLWVNIAIIHQTKYKYYFTENKNYFGYHIDCQNELEQINRCTICKN